MYPPEMTNPMKEELKSNGINSLEDADAVKNFMAKEGETKVLFINSVCGCSSRTARPGFLLSLENETIPVEKGTVFAGVDAEATQQARSYINGYPPSSPSIAFFRKNQLIYFLERSDIDKISEKELSEVIKSVYNKFFGKEIDESLKIKKSNAVEEISVAEVKEELEADNIRLIDCRTPEERDIAVIEKSQLLTEDLVTQMQSWNKNEKMVVYCHHGNRSKQAILFLKQFGFQNLYSMEGGIDFWSQEIDSSIPRY